ncbi:MAG TPA: signal peptidase I [Spirochaetes bacterium]|nr:signal peptidase I [Spirochaetota bacterium]
MKNKIIRSTVIKERSPLAAALLSFFFTGLGQYYNGEAAKGTVLFLLRLTPLLLVPAQGTAGVGASPVKIFFFMVLASFLAWVAAVPEAALRAYTGGPAALMRYNRPAVYGAFAVISTLALSVGVAAALMFFGFHRAAGDRMEPGIVKGDVLLVDRGPRDRRRGEVILHRTPAGPLRMSRVVGLPGDEVSVAGHTFLVNGAALPVGVLTPSELAASGLPNREDLYFEINSGFRYAVSADGEKVSRKKAASKAFKVAPGALFVVGDNRKSDDVHETVEIQRVLGAVSGVLYSASPGRFLAEPMLPDGK